jgi:hypothetical protein
MSQVIARVATRRQPALSKSAFAVEDKNNGS